MLLFLVLLLILARKRSIRDEPRGVLVILLTLLGFVVACIPPTVAVINIVTGPATPCHSVLSFGLGALVAFKMTALFLAVDQFVAIVHCLHYYTIMDVWIQRMIGVVCGCILLFGIFGLVCFHFEMENAMEYHRRVFGVKSYPTHCSYKQLPNVYMATVEITMLVLAIAACALVLYTAILGLRYKRSITQQEEVAQETQLFMTNLKSFKKIIKALLVLFVVDIGCWIVRVISLLFPQSTVAALLRLLRFIGLVIECWTYGLGHATIRAELRRYLCWRRGNPPAGLPTVQQTAELPTVQQPAELPTVQQTAELPSVQHPSDMPSIQQAAELPSVQLLVELPLSQQTAQLPLTQQAAELPSVQLTVELPLIQQTVELPSTQRTAELHSVQQTAELPSVQQTAEVPSIQHPSDMPPIHQPAELPSIQQTAELPSVQLIVELPLSQHTAQLPLAQQEAELPSVQLTVELPLIQQTVELPSTQQTAELPSVQQTAELPSVQQTAELSSVQQPADMSPIQQTAELPSIQQAAELPSVQQRAEMPPIQ